MNSANNVTRLRTRQERLQDASDWVARFDRGLREGEKKALEAWLEEDAANREALAVTLDVWDKSDSLRRLAELFPKPVKRRDRMRPFVWSGVAAAGVAAALFLWLQQTQLPDAGSGTQPDATARSGGNQFQTRIGARETFELADGSSVDLNTNSLIDVRFETDRRELTLHRGEATFSVAHDPGRPFSVTAGGTVFEAVGTEFNLEITADEEIELLVTDGRVLVAAAPRQAGNVATLSDPPMVAAPVFVAAGEEFTVGSAAGGVRVVDVADIAVRLSWRQDNLIFRGETLEAALAEIGRYTTVEFVLLDDGLRYEPVGGLFKVGDVEGTLQTLENNFGVEYEMAEGNRVLLSRR